MMTTDQGIRVPELVEVTGLFISVPATWCGCEVFKVQAVEWSGTVLWAMEESGVSSLWGEKGFAGRRVLS
jgi:hypothetical protein